MESIRQRVVGHTVPRAEIDEEWRRRWWREHRRTAGGVVKEEQEEQEEQEELEEDEEQEEDKEDSGRGVGWCTSKMSGSQCRRSD